MEFLKVYFDVKTYRPDEEAMKDEGVIAVGYLEDRGGDLSREDVKVIAKWDLKWEEVVVRTFYSYLKGLLGKKVELVGFNVLRFDVPLLTLRGVELGVGTLRELTAIWNSFMVRDLMQVLLAANGWRYRGLKFSNVARAAGMDVEDHGAETAEAFERGRYDLIERWLVDDVYALWRLDRSRAVEKMIRNYVERGVRLDP
ncbi:hypothetical protein HS1genome_1717 [Sulfodiicoccus acidiphilus]|uniref:Uncharacterized protein n=1 Tax=Sulfodiicoccus acidiphilus TaxID=1670455 RepID=A0A348B576_9CREN|nr:hypothetical protein [Sulfodiicoccus acidiphilus]BBD73328.1 hypothetical protein HS1genome_1717 [Sulfodiicoccus acidiphilus]GGT89071.1 hypothetical protein GCM10007116_03620 [Sulfodiicoccus acidiphilus]